MKTVTAKTKAAAKANLTASGSRTLAQKLAGLNRMREQFNPLQGLKLSRAVRLASDYFRGDMADLQWTYFFIEQTDPDLLALLELRFGKLVEMDYNLKTAQGADEKLAEDQVAFLEEKFDRIDNLSEAIEHLGMAAFRGFAHCEKWFTDGELTHLEIVDQWNCVRDGLVGGWRYNPDARSVNFRGLSADNDMPVENFLYREVRRPINRIALYKFVRSNLNEVDWDSFNAIYGIPGGVVIGPPDVPEESEKEFEDAANEIAEGGTGYLPNGADWKPNTAARGTHPFKERLDHLSEKLVLAGTGGMLTMLARSGTGTLAGNAHSDVFDTIASAEAARISERINKQLVKAWLDEEFPGEKQVAYFGLAADEETNVSQVITDIKTLFDAGYQVEVAQVEEKTGYSVTLKAPAAPAIAPGADPTVDPAITNRAAPGNAGAVVRFETSAARQLAAADLVVLAPIINRVSPIRAEISRLDGLDDAGFSAGMAALQPQLDALRQDLPALERQVLANRADLEGAFTEILGTAFVSGAAEAARVRESLMRDAAQSPTRVSGVLPPPLAGRGPKTGPLKRLKGR